MSPVLNYIHPFLYHVSRARSRWQQCQVAQTSISIATFFSSSWGILRHSLNRCIISPACSLSAPLSPASWTCPENLQRKTPRRHPDPFPTSAGSFGRKGAAAFFGRLYPRSNSFGHYQSTSVRVRT